MVETREVVLVTFHVLGMIAGTVLIAWRFHRAGERAGVRFFLGFIVLIGIGIAGTRFLYVLSDVSYYAAHWREVFSLQDGTIIQGALLLGFPAVIGLAYLLGMPYWRLADLIVPGLALGQAIGRIGCLTYGCCYGLPVHLPHLEMGVTWVYPTQMMHAVANLSIMVILLALDRFRTKPFDGFLTLMYALLFSTQRYLIDLLRATGAVFAADMPFAGVRVAQVFSIATILVALTLLAWKWRRARRRTAAGEQIAREPQA
jgi:phosphatidylglycerol:prolipoprotein diacylglycerol transferase